MNFQKIFPMTDRIYLGLAGLATDVQTLAQQFKYRVNVYKLKEDRDIKPITFAHMVSSALYERRYAIERALRRADISR